MKHNYKDIAPEINEIVGKINAGTLTDEMLDYVLREYSIVEKGNLGGCLFPILLVIMARMTRQGLRRFTFAWVREHIEPPTHYSHESSRWLLVYRFSEEHIGMIEIKDDLLVDYCRICACGDTNTWINDWTQWDDPIGWSK